jgi:uncharacterized membrane protein
MSKLTILNLRVALVSIKELMLCSFGYLLIKISFIKENKNKKAEEKEKCLVKSSSHLNFF